ncbi:MAG TPA: hypothetical protein VND40_00090 [Nitrososphaerales archaeon]|nr:hypothetical protein [Nitrososphaerales archaeon]
MPSAVKPVPLRYIVVFGGPLVGLMLKTACAAKAGVAVETRIKQATAEATAAARTAADRVPVP